ALAAGPAVLRRRHESPLPPFGARGTEPKDRRAGDLAGGSGHRRAGTSVRSARCDGSGVRLISRASEPDPSHLIPVTSQSQPVGLLFTAIASDRMTKTSPRTREPTSRFSLKLLTT